MIADQAAMTTLPEGLHLSFGWPSDPGLLRLLPTASQLQFLPRV